MPCGERALAAVPDGGAEDTLRLEREVDRLSVLLHESDSDRRRHAQLGLARWELQRTEHVLVRLCEPPSARSTDKKGRQAGKTNLVVARAEHELGVGIVIQNPLHDLALVHRARPHL